MSLPDLPERPADGHKGTFGSVCIIGGQRSEAGRVMIGAPSLCANAAMRSGCGNAMLAMAQPILQSGLQLAPTATGIELPVDEVGRIIPSAAIEAIDSHALGCRCLAIGPGLGSEWPQQQIVAALLAREERPIVLDADGLNALAQLKSAQLDLRAPTIMTPHPREYQRLCEAMGTNAQNPEELAQAYGCILVLKSDVIKITNGVDTFEETRGGVELATGGTGDVLAGIIAGLLVQYGSSSISHVFDSAVLGASIHAMSGALYAKEHGSTGMLATDLLERIPAAIATMRK